MNEVAAAERPRTLWETVNSIAGLLAAGGGGLLSSGDVAALRRMDPRRLEAPGFFKLVGAVLEPQLPSGGQARDEAEMRWAAIVVGLAHLGGLHRPGERLGTALVAADFSEARFIRLLRADGEQLLDDIPSLARFLAAKEVAVDFTWAARLLLSADRKDEEETRRQIARDYYSALFAKENTSES